MGFFFIAGIVELPQAMADPPPWAPAHGYRAKKHRVKRAYRYYYYPAQQVYYSPVKRVYYYQNAGTWTYAPALPPTINLGNKVSISLGTPTPYTVHPTVIQTYPVIVTP